MIGFIIGTIFGFVLAGTLTGMFINERDYLATQIKDMERRLVQWLRFVYDGGEEPENFNEVMVCDEEGGLGQVGPFGVEPLHERFWFCTIGPATGPLPGTADRMFRAVAMREFRLMFGEDAEICFSGWDAKLTVEQRNELAERRWRRENEE